MGNERHWVQEYFQDEYIVIAEVIDFLGSLG